MFQIKVAKKDLFISIFHLLKNCSTSINAIIDKQFFHIQGMDKSHICLFDVVLQNSWFEEYNVSQNTNICFDTNTFFSIISMKCDNNELFMKMTDTNNDSLYISFASNTSHKKMIKLPLLEYEYDEMNINTVDYDAEFSLLSKQVTDHFNELEHFGDDIAIRCSENEIQFNTKSVKGEMGISIPIDDLTQYSIVENEKITLTYSISYINKMCISNKLSKEILFFLSNDCPMKIKYDLGIDGSLSFYIAPKIPDSSDNFDEN